MRFDLFISFNGECREAADFYARVFRSEILNMQTYGDAPASEGYVTPEADRNRVMYCCVPIFNCNVMLCDSPTGSPSKIGTNICPTLGNSCKNELTRIFNEIKEGGKAVMELQPTFFSEMFGMVTDKYGITWQLSYFA